MDVMDAINLLKKYNIYDDAKNECRRLKIDEAPYDMQGHHDVYCRYLSSFLLVNRLDRNAYK